MTALEDAARRYVAATIAHQGATGTGVLEALLEREQAEHELIVRAGFECPYCAGGVCPMGEEWQDARDRDAEDRERLLRGDLDRS